MTNNLPSMSGELRQLAADVRENETRPSAEEIAVRCEMIAARVEPMEMLIAAGADDVVADDTVVDDADNLNDVVAVDDDLTDDLSNG